MKTSTLAHTGTTSWLVQRASAVVMALAVLVFAWRIGRAAPLDYPAWKALFETLSMRLVTMLFTVALALHAWVGMRDIFMDYVHHTGIRLVLHLGVLLTLASCVLWMASILWGAV